MKVQGSGYTAFSKGQLLWIYQFQGDVDIVLFHLLCEY